MKEIFSTEQCSDIREKRIIILARDNLFLQSKVSACLFWQPQVDNFFLRRRVKNFLQVHRQTVKILML